MVVGLKPLNDQVSGRPWFEYDPSRQWWLNLSQTSGFGWRLVDAAKQWDAQQAARSGQEAVAPVSDVQMQNKIYVDEAD